MLHFGEQAVRVGRGEIGGQHVLYVAHELQTFNDFRSRHNQHIVEMGECAPVADPHA